MSKSHDVSVTKNLGHMHINAHGTSMNQMANRPGMHKSMNHYSSHQNIPSAKMAGIGASNGSGMRPMDSAGLRMGDLPQQKESIESRIEMPHDFKPPQPTDSPEKGREHRVKEAWSNLQPPTNLPSRGRSSHSISLAAGMGPTTGNLMNR